MKALAELLEVKTIQRAAAEMALARAIQTTRGLTERRERRAEQLDRDQASWSDRVGGGSLDLTLARAWAGEIERGAGTLVSIGQGVERALAAQSKARSAMSAAIRGVDAVEDLSRTARRRLARKTDEAALEALGEQTARGGGRL